MTAPRFDARALRAYGAALLDAAGMEPAKSAVIADVLVEADLLGHDTHGLNLLAAYLGDIEKGLMATQGEPRVVRDFPAAVTWDGRRLPGTWLTVQAIELASARARTQGTCTVVIGNSHHIACLAAYLERVTARGQAVQVWSSAPENHSVAPFGGREGVITPNPIAAAWPTDRGPVMLDVSMSITTNGMVNRCTKLGTLLPGKWLIDADGHPTDDPLAVTQRGGALLPIGGTDHGHKGWALALMVDAFTQGFAGHGRADPIEGQTGEVFVQVYEPEAFAGRAAFLRQATWMADAAHAVAPMAGFERVRLPGEAGLARKAAALRDGVTLHPLITPALAPWAQKFGVAPPAPLG
ncbi:MAG: Ldh family oxidoreductase [Burkholderiales bacterium]|jgi:L-lactate dehydrogenase|nr:Ldh family oxidoreductase [Burkholderiales bacterium]